MTKRETVEKAIKVCDYGFWAGICGIISIVFTFLGLAYFGLVYWAFLAYTLLASAELFGDKKIKIGAIFYIITPFLAIITVTYGGWLMMKTATENIMMSQTFTSLNFIEIARSNFVMLTLLILTILSLGASQLFFIYSLLEFSKKFKIKSFLHTAIALVVFLILLALEKLLLKENPYISILMIISGFTFLVLLSLSFRKAKNVLENISKEIQD